MVCLSWIHLSLIATYYIELMWTVLIGSVTMPRIIFIEDSLYIIQNESITPKSWMLITKYIQDWNFETEIKFKEALVSDEIQNRLNAFSKTDHIDVNEATKKFTEIIQLALQTTG